MRIPFYSSSYLLKLVKPQAKKPSFGTPRTSPNLPPTSPSAPSKNRRVDSFESTLSGNALSPTATEGSPLWSDGSPDNMNGYSPIMSDGSPIKDENNSLSPPATSSSAPQKSKGKGGRKQIFTYAQRKDRNRQAQKEFRERRDALIKGLTKEASTYERFTLTLCNILGENIADTERSVFNPQLDKESQRIQNRFAVLNRILDQVQQLKYQQQQQPQLPFQQMNQEPIQSDGYLTHQQITANSWMQNSASPVQYNFDQQTIGQSPQNSANPTTNRPAPFPPFGPFQFAAQENEEAKTHYQKVLNQFQSNDNPESPDNDAESQKWLALKFVPNPDLMSSLPTNSLDELNFLAQASQGDFTPLLKPNIE